jgi:hypothetical protein
LERECQRTPAVDEFSTYSPEGKTTG